MSPSLKIKYVGTGETGLTQNSVYTVFSLLGSASALVAVILNDNGQLYVTDNSVLNTSNWTVESASELQCVGIE